MYNQRIKIFLALIAVVFLAVSARLCQLQIIHGDAYRSEIVQKLRQDDILPASRGHILDRQGAILACDEPCFDLCVDYRLIFLWINNDPNHPFLRSAARWRRRQEDQIAQLLRPVGDANYKEQIKELASEIFSRRAAASRRLLAEMVGSEEGLMDALQEVYDRVEAIRAASEHKNPQEQYQFHPIVTDLGDAKAMAVKTRLDGLAGLYVRPSFKRRYPYGALACHVIGYTGKLGEKEMSKSNLTADQADDLTRRLINYAVDDVIGKTGVEKMCEGFPSAPVSFDGQKGPLQVARLDEIDRQLGLRGRKGYRKRSRLTGEVVEEIPAVQGRDVHLTLDIALQDDLTRLFPAGATGSIVVLALPRGEVLAMVSAPNFDLNTFRRDYPELARDKIYLPLRNRAVSQLYPPGSTAKPLIALAALGCGAIDLNYTHDCTGYLVPGDTSHWRCWTVERNLGGHGTMNTTDALKNSCNVFFYSLGELIGEENVVQWLRRFGFTALPGTGLPEERSGIVANKLSRDDCRQIGIGQGPVAVTPLHVANAMATIARTGQFRTPVLVLDAGKPQEISDLPLRQEHLAAVKLGMYKVANESGGTAFKVFYGGDIQPLGVEICGKTGTATVSALKTDEGERRGNMAWFAGFAPYDEPKIAFAVVVEYVEGGGAINAGPIARETVRACVQRGYLQKD